MGYDELDFSTLKVLLNPQDDLIIQQYDAYPDVCRAYYGRAERRLLNPFNPLFYIFRDQHKIPFAELRTRNMGSLSDFEAILDHPRYHEHKRLLVANPLLHAYYDSSGQFNKVVIHPTYAFPDLERASPSEDTLKDWSELLIMQGLSLQAVRPDILNEEADEDVIKDDELSEFNNLIKGIIQSLIPEAIIDNKVLKDIMQLLQRTKFAMYLKILYDKPDILPFELLQSLTSHLMGEQSTWASKLGYLLVYEDSTYKYTPWVRDDSFTWLEANPESIYSYDWTQGISTAYPFITGFEFYVLGNSLNFVTYNSGAATAKTSIPTQIDPDVFPSFENRYIHNFEEFARSHGFAYQRYA